MYACLFLQHCSFTKLLWLPKVTATILILRLEILMNSVGKVATLTRTTCGIGSQTMFGIMNISWGFTAGAEKYDNNNDAHQDFIITLSPIIEFNGSVELTNGFHMFAIRFLVREHTGPDYSSYVSKVFNAFCVD